MKNLFLVLFTILLSVTGCTGPVGPQGPQGPQGTYVVGQTYEYTLNFTPGNNYEVIVNFPKAIFASDVVLVYILEGQDNGNDIWRPVPRQAFFGQSTLSYEYDFTRTNIRLFIDADPELNLLTLPDWTLDQVFRIVVVPSDKANRMIDASYNEVIQTFKLSDKDFIRP